MPLSAGHRNPAVAQAPQDHTECQRDHQKVDVAHVRDDEPEQRGQDRAREEAGRSRCPESCVIRRRQHAHAVRGDAEEGSVAQRRKARVAEQQIQAHREHGQDHHLRQESDPVGRQKGWADDEERRKQREEGQPPADVDGPTLGHTARWASAPARAPSAQRA